MKDGRVELRMERSQVNRYRSRARELGLDLSAWVRLACACLERWQDEMPAFHGTDPRLPNWPKDRPKP